MQTIKTVPFIIKENKHTCYTSQGPVTLHSYEKKKVICGTWQDVNVGDPVKVFNGKKIPIGTEAVIKAIGHNKFEASDINPCLLLTLKDDSQVWTTGRNCYSLLDLGVENKVRELDEISFQSLDLQKLGYENSKDVWHFEKSPNKVPMVTNVDARGNTKHFSILELDNKELLFKETSAGVAMVVRHWDPVYCAILVMDKTFKPGNCKEFTKFKTFAEACEAFTKI